MTAERPGSASPVYGLYGKLNTSALTLSELTSGEAVLRQIPVDVLVALETGSLLLRDEAVAQVIDHAGLPLVAAAGFDDWWTTALDVLNDTFPLAHSRRLVTDKGRLYQRLHDHGVAAPGFLLGELSTELVSDAIARYGRRPVLKPNTGAGSRGVYRYRADLPVADNLALYREVLRLGHIDSSTKTLAMEYIGGPNALEVSVDVLVDGAEVCQAVVHEKLTATQVHPFVDRVMVSPPVNPEITAALPALSTTMRQVVSVLGLNAGVLHAELRLHHGTWYILDIGVRPGSGLVAHSVQALTGVDPRLAHLFASIGQPLATTYGKPTYTATCIACCYVSSDARPDVTLARQSTVVSELRQATDVIGWHLNAAETDDQLYLPDAGLSVGVGADAPHVALNRLRSLVEPHRYSTS